MPPEPSFGATLAAAQQGDESALDRLFSQFYPQVQMTVHRQLATDFRHGRQWVSSILSTADVVQDVFIKVLRCIDDFRGDSEQEFLAYLTTLTRNRILDALRFHTAMRRDSRRLVEESERVQDDKSHGAGPLIARDELARYAAVLASFSDRDRLLLRSRLEGGDQAPPFESLAQDLGFASAGAARQAYFRARARLALLLGDQDER